MVNHVCLLLILSLLFVLNIFFFNLLLKISMAKEDIVLVFENIGGVDEDIHMLSKNPTTNLSNVENVHL